MAHFPLDPPTDYHLTPEQQEQVIQIQHDYIEALKDAAREYRYKIEEIEGDYLSKWTKLMYGTDLYYGETQASNE